MVPTLCGFRGAEGTEVISTKTGRKENPRSAIKLFRLAELTFSVVIAFNHCCRRRPRNKCYSYLGSSGTASSSSFNSHSLFYDCCRRSGNGRHKLAEVNARIWLEIVLIFNSKTWPSESRRIGSFAETHFKLPVELQFKLEHLLSTDLIVSQWDREWIDKETINTTMSLYSKYERPFY